MYRVLITGFRKYWDPARISRELDSRLSAHPDDLELVMLGLWEGPELQAQDWVKRRRKEGHKIALDLWQFDVRTHGRKPDPVVVRGMVQSGIDECLAFVDSGGRPQKMGGMLGCARECEALQIPTTRFGRTWAPEAFRPRIGKARVLPEGTYSDRHAKRKYG